MPNKKRGTLSINPDAGKKGAKAAPPPVTEEIVQMEDVRNLSSAAASAILASPDVSIRDVRARIEEIFQALGTDALPGTVIPAGKSNNSKEAADYVLAEMLAKMSAERLKKASEAADKAGVFGDKSDYVTGDTVLVHSDPNFSINVKMGRPVMMVKRELVEAAAEKYLGKKADDFLSECKGERKPTQQIIVSMK